MLVEAQPGHCLKSSWKTSSQLRHKKVCSIFIVFQSFCAGCLAADRFFGCGEEIGRNPLEVKRNENRSISFINPPWN